MKSAGRRSVTGRPTDAVRRGGSAGGIKRREVAQYAAVAGQRQMDDLMIGTDLVSLEHLRERTNFQHGADGLQGVPPDLAVPHMEKDCAIIPGLRALHIADVETDLAGRVR